MWNQDCYQIRNRNQIPKNKSRSKEKQTRPNKQLCNLKKIQSGNLKLADEGHMDSLQNMVQAQNQMYKLMLEVSQSMLKLSLTPETPSPITNNTLKPLRNNRQNQRQKKGVRFCKSPNKSQKLQDIQQTKQQNQSSSIQVNQKQKNAPKQINMDYYIDGFVRSVSRNSFRSDFINSNKSSGKNRVNSKSKGNMKNKSKSKQKKFKVQNPTKQTKK